MDLPSVPRSEPPHPHGREAMWNAITRVPGEPSPDRKPRPKLDWRRALRLEGLRLRRDSRRPERQLIRRLRRLDFCQGALAVEPIAGGITNHNFVVRAGGRSYVARLCQARPLLGIDRRNEV